MEEINKYLLLAISLVAMVSYTTLRNFFTKKCVKNDADFYAFNFLVSAMCLVVLIINGKGELHISPYTFIMGLVFGLITAVNAIISMFAIKSGPICYTMIIIYSSLVIAAFSGRVFWNEKIYFNQIIGLILLIFCIILAVPKSQNANEKKATFKWLALSLIAFFTSGLIGVMQKFHQKSDHSDELTGFLIIAFAVCSIYSLVAYFIILTKNNNKQAQATKFSLSYYIIALVCGIFTAVMNILNLYLSGVIDTIIFFPVVSGGSLILSSILAIIIFKEHFTKRQMLGIFLGLLSITLLCNLIPSPF